jgi:hypothetical protein
LGLEKCILLTFQSNLDLAANPITTREVICHAPYYCLAIEYSRWDCSRSCA